MTAVTTGRRFFETPCLCSFDFFLLLPQINTHRSLDSLSHGQTPFLATDRDDCRLDGLSRVARSLRGIFSISLLLRTRNTDVPVLQYTGDVFIAFFINYRCICFSDACQTKSQMNSLLPITAISIYTTQVSAISLRGKS